MFKISPGLFQNLEGRCPNFGKNAQIVVIYGLNFSLKMQFLEFPGEKRGNLSCGAFASRVVNYYQVTRL